MREYVIGSTKTDADFVARKLDLNPVYAVTREQVADRGFLRGRGQMIRLFVTHRAMTMGASHSVAAYQRFDRMRQELRAAELRGATIIPLAEDVAWR